MAYHLGAYGVRYSGSGGIIYGFSFGETAAGNGDFLRAVASCEGGPWVEPLKPTIWNLFDISPMAQGRGSLFPAFSRGYGPSFGTFLT